MNFPFISILSIIDEVKLALKKIAAQSNFSQEDLYMFAADAARLIGQTCYVTQDAYLDVNKHQCILPLNIYSLTEIELCNSTNFCFNAGIPADATKLGTNMIRPADTATMNRCTEKCRQSTKGSKLTFTMKIPPGVMRFSFYSGKVYIKFRALMLDSDGILMVQDEANSIEAIKNYLIISLLKEDYILGNITRYVYKDFEQKWEEHKEKAQQAFKFMSPVEMDIEVLKMDQRYRIYNYKHQ